MLEQLKIENFRCFKSFELNHLGRVNLLVGENNCGKSSILEAIKLFYSKEILLILKEIALNRGETFSDEQINISHFFNGHEVSDDGQELSISGVNKKQDGYLKLQILNYENSDKYNQIKEKIKTKYPDQQASEFINFKSVVEQEWRKQAKSLGLSNKPLVYDLSLDGEIIKKSDYWIGEMPLKLLIYNESQILKTKLVSSSSLTPQESLELFNQVVLTPEEDLVYEALQIIEPNIERIAPIGNEIKNNNSRSGFFVRLSDTQKRIPIGSMGDGIWRMLGLSLALVSAKDGVLLVDEIDTGLHYTALENMWKLIWETSKKLNVQVFATTHNSDCWKALEALTNREDVAEKDISIQRIEKDAPRSVAYNKEEIATAVERETEVR